MTKQEPSAHTVRCPVCQGSGKCQTCKGKGILGHLKDGTPIPCVACAPRVETGGVDGKCWLCHGDGKYGEENYDSEAR